MEFTTLNSAATEHANDDNTEPCGSDATERAGTIEVMMTPAYAASTCDIAIGPCRLRCMENEHSILCTMQLEIDRRFRVPATLQQMEAIYENARMQGESWNRRMQGKSWSSALEAISRCIAAFQKATDATEHSNCEDIATKMCDYAIVLTRKTPAYCGHGELLALIHQYMTNRTYNLAFAQLLDQMFPRGGDSRYEEKYLRIIEMCIVAIRNQEEVYKGRMDVYRARWNGGISDEVDDANNDILALLQSTPRSALLQSTPRSAHSRSPRSALSSAQLALTDHR